MYKNLNYPLGLADQSDCLGTVQNTGHLETEVCRETEKPVMDPKLSRDRLVIVYYLSNVW